MRRLKPPVLFPLLTPSRPPLFSSLSSAGINFAHKRISEIVGLLSRYEAVNSNQKRALNSARVAAEQFRKTLEDGKTHLSACKLRDEEGQLIYAGSSKAIVPQPPLVQRMIKQAPPPPRSNAHEGGAPPHRAPTFNDYEDASQGSQTLLELAGASQISLTGELAGLYNSQEADEPPAPTNSQDSAASRLSLGADAASPQRPDPASSDPSGDPSSDPSDTPSRRSGRRPAPTEKAEEAGLRKRAKLEHDADDVAAAGGAIWPPASMAAPAAAAAPPAAAAVPPPGADSAHRPPMAALAYEEPMGSQEQVSALELLGSQVSTMGSPHAEGGGSRGGDMEVMANGPSPMAHHVAPPQAVA